MRDCCLPGIALTSHANGLVVFLCLPPGRTGCQAYVAIHCRLRGDLLSRFADAGHGRSLCVTSSSALLLVSNVVLCLRSPLGISRLSIYLAEQWKNDPRNPYVAQIKKEEEHH